MQRKTTKGEREALLAILDDCEDETYCLEEHLFIRRPTLRALLHDAELCATLEKEVAHIRGKKRR